MCGAQNRPARSELFLVRLSFKLSLTAGFVFPPPPPSPPPPLALLLLHPLPSESLLFSLPFPLLSVCHSAAAGVRFHPLFYSPLQKTCRKYEPQTGERQPLTPKYFVIISRANQGAGGDFGGPIGARRTETRSPPRKNEKL